MRVRLTAHRRRRTPLPARPEAAFRGEKPGAPRPRSVPGRPVPALDPRRVALPGHHGLTGTLPGGLRRAPGRRAVGVVCGAGRPCRARSRPRRGGGHVVPGGPGHAHVPLPVRRRLHPAPRPPGGSQPQCRLADPQQRPGRQRDRPAAHPRPVQRRAVGGVQVGDGDAAVRGHRHRAVQPGDVRVVEGHVGVGGAADADLTAVQQMDTAGVGARDHLELGRGVVPLGMRLRLPGRADGQHGTVGQRGLAERAALRVEPLLPGVQHRRARTVAAGDHLGERRGHRRERRTGRCRDQDVAAWGAVPPRSRCAQRIYDGQPDLHRRQRSLLPGHGAPRPAPARRPVLQASSHLPLTPRPSLGKR